MQLVQKLGDINPTDYLKKANNSETSSTLALQYITDIMKGKSQEEKKRKPVESKNTTRSITIDCIGRQKTKDNNNILNASVAPKQCWTRFQGHST